MSSKSVYIMDVVKKMVRPTVDKPISRQAFYIRMEEAGIKPHKAIRYNKMRSCITKTEAAKLLRIFRKDYPDALR